MLKARIKWSLWLDYAQIVCCFSLNTRHYCSSDRILLTINFTTKGKANNTVVDAIHIQVNALQMIYIQVFIGCGSEWQYTQANRYILSENRLILPILIDNFKGWKFFAYPTEKHPLCVIIAQSLCKSMLLFLADHINLIFISFFSCCSV